MNRQVSRGPYDLVEKVASITGGTGGIGNATARELNALPPPFRLRSEPETAGCALADGLARRAPRVVVPARWNGVSALRGLINPLLDVRLSRDPSTLGVLTELDRPHRNG